MSYSLGDDATSGTPTSALGFSHRPVPVCVRATGLVFRVFALRSSRRPTIRWREPQSAVLSKFNVSGRRSLISVVRCLQVFHHFPPVVELTCGMSLCKRFRRFDAGVGVRRSVTRTLHPRHPPALTNLNLEAEITVSHDSVAWPCPHRTNRWSAAALGFWQFGVVWIFGRTG